MSRLVSCLLVCFRHLAENFAEFREVPPLLLAFHDWLALEDPGQFTGGFADCIAVSHSWPGNILVLEQDCICDAPRPACFYVNIESAIVEAAGTNVPAIHAVLCQ